VEHLELTGSVRERPMIDYGMNSLWVTPIKRQNLLDDGLVDPDLHRWLEQCAQRPEVTPRDYENLYLSSQMFQRHNQEIFKNPHEPELQEIKRILTRVADEYVGEVFGEIGPHDLESVLWFVRQRSGQDTDAVSPHFHERGDVVFCYYLDVPADGSGRICFLDPRGCIGRGGYSIPRNHPLIQVEPRRGDIIISPRYVLHYTTTNTDSHDRSGIAGILRYERS
jgi:hypothetical protein